VKELLETLGALASRKADVKDQRELCLDLAELVVKAACGTFGVKNDEVAILLLTSDQQHLRFVAPRRFADLGTIPLTKRDSIAVAVFGRGRGEAQNNVPTVKHVAFFESVKIRDRAAPIQKMITTPILYKDAAVGVAQISRKGETPGQAGADFGDADVRKAESFFRELAPYLWQARPDRF
jgi:hypothetical protein